MSLRHLLVTAMAAVTVCTAAAGDNPRVVRAVRTPSAPRLDGSLDEEVWRSTQAATDFLQREPEEGRPGSERSEVRVLYDDEALYFGCMFYDSEPSKIVARLTRRDNEIESDNASIRIDAYHDHQTGYEFTFNAAGVKTDILQYDDANREDNSWDPVWEVQTVITDRGWSAEVKIPFRILRYRSASADSDGTTWGINFLRYISRRQESQRWAFTPKREGGFISRFGHLEGLRGLPAPRQFEVLPFATGKESYDAASALEPRRQDFTANAGVDLKYGLSSSFTLDATINPDFGQVEADPAVLNLSTFETFYPEKRPFFVGGTQIIRFTTFGGDFGPGMFYSRRIGRAISHEELTVPAGGRIDELPSNVTILGAAKLTGRTNGGLSIGMLQAITQEERGRVIDSTGAASEQLVEPFANFGILRLKQDVMENSNVGMIITSTLKDGRIPAFTNGYDWNLKFDQNTYNLLGFLALSHTTNGTGERMTGSAGKAEFSRIGAEHWLWSLSTDFTSPKYNINDAGFFFSPDDYGAFGRLTYKEDVPAAAVRNFRVSLSLHLRQNFEGINLFRQISADGGMLFANYWSLSAGGNAELGLYDHRETRGNGIYARPHAFQMSGELSTDPRNEVVVRLSERVAWDALQKRGYATSLGVNLKPLSWMEWTVETSYQRVRNEEAWILNNGPYAFFGDRNTDQYNMTLRGTVTFTRELTLQLYAQVFLAKGSYSNYRRLQGVSEFVPEPPSPDLAGRDFNRKSLNSNVVLRWEYLPGSTLFLVWSQARSDRDANALTDFSTDFDATFRVPPSNVLLLKASYLLTL